MVQFVKAATVAVALLVCGPALAQQTATPVSAAQQEGLTQELSAACRTVVTTRWSNGRRISVRKRACSPSYGYAQPYRSYGYAQPYYRSYGAASCRTVVKYRYSNGRRVSVRTRVC
jgi:hypothetical protein